MIINKVGYFIDVDDFNSQHSGFSTKEMHVAAAMVTTLWVWGLETASCGGCRGTFKQQDHLRPAPLGIHCRHNSLGGQWPRSSQWRNVVTGGYMACTLTMTRLSNMVQLMTFNSNRNKKRGLKTPSKGICLGNATVWLLIIIITVAVSRATRSVRQLPWNCNCVLHMVREGPCVRGRSIYSSLPRHECRGARQYRHVRDRTIELKDGSNTAETEQSSDGSEDMLSRRPCMVLFGYTPTAIISQLSSSSSDPTYVGKINNNGALTVPITKNRISIPSS